jgi:D-glycero-alpha-D-manno-heptose-7-phosphate kinase
MIISTAPLRLSYLGGGTDYEMYSKEYGGKVIGSTINKKVYVFINELSPIAEENIRFTYRKIESVANSSELIHPVVREVLQRLAPNERLNIATFADLPGKTGLGSSSAFTVALINGIQSFLEKKVFSKSDLAEFAVNVERNILNEIGGVQDQFHATFGNLRSYEFVGSKAVISQPFYSDTLLEELSSYHFLLYVGAERNSSRYAEQTKQNILDKESLRYFHEMKLLAEEGILQLPKLNSAKAIIQNLSSLMNESWSIKKHFGKDISNNIVESKINLGLSSGASAAKLCGAGNSGFILFLVPESNREEFKLKFKNEVLIQVSLNPHGATTLRN